MDIETIDPTKINKKPFITVEIADVGHGHHITNVIFEAEQIDPNSIISAAINIFSTFLDYVPEKLQNEMEESLMKGFNDGMKNRFERIRTIKP